MTRCTILIADDDEDDRFLINRAMKECEMRNHLYFLGDGQELVDHLAGYLSGTHPGANPVLPCLILLDLNMPRMDGREALKIVKNHNVLKRIPVVIMSNSKSPEDVEYSYKEGANSFFTKPLDYVNLVSLMSLLKAYWLNSARLPENN